MIMTIANVLTISRIILTPFIIQCLVCEQWNSAGILFGIAALTDVCDGILARLMSQETTLGACLDPLADKFLIVGCYVTLLYTYGAQVGIPLWLVVLVVARETLLILGAVSLGYLSLRKHYSPKTFMIRPTLWGKWTTVGHCVILSMIYTMRAGLWNISSSVIEGMAVATGALMLVSGMQYSSMWWRIMRSL